MTTGVAVVDENCETRCVIATPNASPNSGQNDQLSYCTAPDLLKHCVGGILCLFLFYPLLGVNTVHLVSFSEKEILRSGSRRDTVVATPKKEKSAGRAALTFTAAAMSRPPMLSAAAMYSTSCPELSAVAASTMASARSYMSGERARPAGTSAVST